MADLLVVICARGGSKGVKAKNIRPLAGAPLMAYTIRQALEWGRAKHVVVSTDSEEIAGIARQYGAEVPFMRPAELATDTASKVLAIKHALTACEKLFGERYPIVVDLDVTAPVRCGKDLDQCLALFEKSRPKTLFSVVQAHKNPYFNLVEPVEGNGRVQVSKNIGRYVMRRQDAPPVYAMNASIYFYDRGYLLETENPSPLTDDSQVYVMDDSAGVDVDREIDFKFLEFLLKEGVVKL
jgi:CMP-N-acetylneuraminic acid synthetase